MNFKIASAALFAAMSTSAAHAECGEVTMTEMNWASSAVVTSVSKFLMEQGYGCTVQAVPSSTVPALVSVAETGKPDIVSELWILGAPTYQSMQDEGVITTLTDVLSDGGNEGWWVPKYLVDEHPELATVEGVLANAELLGGRFHSCPDGWACKFTNDDLTRNFGLTENGYEIFIHGSGETLATSLASAYESKEPWIGYYWSPTSLLGKYEMVAVDQGPYNEEVFECAANPECTAEGLSGWPVGPVKTVVTNDFADREPDIAALMTNVSFTNAQMGDVLAWKEANNASNDEAAVYFLTTYSDVWPAWLNDEAREKLSALIQ
ncbi:ABC transporter substrate-binding protein [Meridianimarinicoccus aquatilis]|uniref:ABC transporter substrate-binding protein n=1 Tax=Meridianimarinicoccus aquatilis TaxID=2552766 RepID=A0A4R6AYT5_9RHOB|nr:ABC transporter substrate-binding protein [Fluviibacterium aquatile]QIE43003.1 ABC transporter substrate-binding protein [Rhodobacteraceae bacterium SC52]TDL88975.1 ABC transporter substrate-binding protein [Fluviibacterium aquatile]